MHADLLTLPAPEETRKNQKSPNQAGKQNPKSNCLVQKLLAPLHSPVYRALWLASLFSNMGTLMQAVAVAWVMTSLTLSPLLVALVPAAALAPVFFFGLAGGALADMIKRRTFLLVTQLWMMLCAIAMGLLVLLDAATPGTLLALTFALGTGNALTLPAWQSLVQDLVPRQQVASAVALNSISFNAGRVLGPVAGGLLVGWIGAFPVFFLNAISFLGTIVVLYLWAGLAPVGKGDGFWKTMGRGLVYVRQASHLHSPFYRLSIFAFGASALLALLPLFARQDLGLVASQYGMLLGFFGGGSLVGGACVPALRRWAGPSPIVAGGALVLGAGLALLGMATSFPMAAVALMTCGFAWVSSMVNLNVSVQMSAPSAMRGRTMSVFLTTFQGSVAFGSLTSGAIAKLAGIPATLWIFGAILVLLGLFTFRHVLPDEKT